MFDIDMRVKDVRENKKIQKKGISPMIATVLLIAFVIAIGGILSVWLSSLVGTQTSQVSTTSDKAAKCSSTSLIIKEVRYNSTQLTAANETNYHAVNVTVQVIGTEGIRNISATVVAKGLSNTSSTINTDSDLNPGQLASISVNVSGGPIGFPPEIVTVRGLCQTTFPRSAECKANQTCMTAVG